MACDHCGAPSSEGQRGCNCNIRGVRGIKVTPTGTGYTVELDSDTAQQLAAVNARTFSPVRSDASRLAAVARPDTDAVPFHAWETQQAQATNLMAAWGDDPDTTGGFHNSDFVGKAPLDGVYLWEASLEVVGWNPDTTALLLLLNNSRNEIVRRATAVTAASGNAHVNVFAVTELRAGDEIAVVASPNLAVNGPHVASSNCKGAIIWQAPLQSAFWSP